MFNNIYVERVIEGQDVQNIRVPLTYGPKQKFIAWLDEMEKVDPDVSTKPPKALTLPRITFEMGTISYDGQRRLPKLSRYTVVDADNNQSYTYTPAPYNIQFKMAVFVKNAEDGTKIMEQILPFFSPDYTVTMHLVPALGDRGTFDTPIILNAAGVQDTYAQGKIEDRRAIIWELEFTMKALFFGPVRGGAKPIKDMYVNLRVPEVGVEASEATPDTAAIVATLNTRPGLTALGEPTTDPNETVTIAEINADDPWDFIESVTEYL
jgi:hypothetical protein